jgi:hypothetical protein
MSQINLLCIKDYKVHWGDILIEGLYYPGTPIEKEVTIVTDHEVYYEKTKLVAGSYLWLRKGHTESELPDLIPGFIPYSEVQRLYTRRIKMPYLSFSTNHGNQNYIDLYTLTDKQIIDIYDLDERCISGPDSRFAGHVSFGTTENSIDDYFDYTPYRRENTLNKII